jgi:hypothetical protein
MRSSTNVFVTNNYSSQVNNQFVNYVINNITNENLRNNMLAEYFLTHRSELQRTSQIPLYYNSPNQQTAHQTPHQAPHQTSHYAPYQTPYSVPYFSDIFMTFENIIPASTRREREHSVLTENEFNAIPIKSFSYVLANNANADIACSVCRSEFASTDQVKYLSCRHFFHVNCVKQWLTQHNSQCPICRVQVLPNSRPNDDATENTVPNTEPDDDVIENRNVTEPDDTETEREDIQPIQNITSNLSDIARIMFPLIRQPLTRQPNQPSNQQPNQQPNQQQNRQRR